MESKERSKVVGIRITTQELLLLQLYGEDRGLSVVELISILMENFLQFPHKIIELKEARFIHKLIEEVSRRKVEDEDSLNPLTFRIGEWTLQKWDALAKSRLITRTTLIRQAINAYFNPNLQLDLKLQDDVVVQFKHILNKVIQRLQKLEYEDIREIFEGVNPKIINELLARLEEEGRIGRKGPDTYVPTTPFEFE